MDKESLWKLRKEIVLNSLYLHDYENSFNIDENIVCSFFDGYMEELNCIMEEKYTTEEIRSLSFDEYYNKLFELDNQENLYNYYLCCEDIGF